MLELPEPAASSIDETDHNVEHVSPVQLLASVASKATLFRSNDGRFFAQVPVGDRFEVYGLKSAAFRDWLIHGYLINQAEPPSQVAIRRAVGMLEARARFDAGIPEVFVRTGRAGDGQGSTYFVDLGDSSGTGRRDSRSRLARGRSAGCPFPAPRGPPAASHAHPRRLDRPAPALC